MTTTVTTDRPPFRVRLDTSSGTVHYVGPVPTASTSGVANAKKRAGKEYYGVEWDDPSRGRHSGLAPTGERLFTPSKEGSASFVPASHPDLERGTSWTEALAGRYGVTASLSLSSSTSATTTIGGKDVKLLDETADAVAVVRSRRHLGLDGSRFAFSDSDRTNSNPSSIEAARCTSLDLSRTLVCDLGQIDRVFDRACPAVTTLRLDNNRFFSVRQCDSLERFGRLTELSLNATLITATELRHLSRWTRSLKKLEFGANELTFDALRDAFEGDIDIWPSLETLNLSENLISDLSTLWPFVLRLPNLKSLILASNRIERSTPISKHASLESLDLSKNPIATLDLLDSLSTLELKSLRVSPLSESTTRTDIVRRVGPSLLTLDGSDVTLAERREALRTGSTTKNEPKQRTDEGRMVRVRHGEKTVEVRVKEGTRVDVFKSHVCKMLGLKGKAARSVRWYAVHENERVSLPSSGGTGEDVLLLPAAHSSSSADFAIELVSS